MPVSGPRQQVDGGAALEDVGILDAATAAGAPSGNLVRSAKLEDGLLKVDIGIRTNGKPANGSGDAAVDAELGIKALAVKGERAPPRLGIAHPGRRIEVPEDLEGIDIDVDRPALRSYLTIQSGQPAVGGEGERPC